MSNLLPFESWKQDKLCILAVHVSVQILALNPIEIIWTPTLKGLIVSFFVIGLTFFEGVMTTPGPSELCIE